MYLIPHFNTSSIDLFWASKGTYLIMSSFAIDTQGKIAYPSTYKKGNSCPL